MSMKEAVEARYRDRWGAPTREAEFRRHGRSVAIYKWDAMSTGEGVTLYTTAGASQYLMQGIHPDHRVEYFVGLNPARDEVASPLAALALYAYEEGVSVGHGHTVPAAGPLWQGSGMSAFLVWRPLLDVIPAFRLPDGTHVEFLQAIPLYQSELAFKSQGRAEDLVDRWRAAKVPFWDPERMPAPDWA
jgi:hypothetical protein